MADMLTEAFKELQLLREENFDYSKQGIDALSDFLDADNLEDTTTVVIDASAKDEEDLEDSYVGKVVFECPVCKSLVYHDADEVEIDEQTDMANVSDDCPYCHSVGGFNVVGEIAPYEKVEVKTEEEEKVEEPIEEGCKHHMSLRRRHEAMTEADKPAAMSIEDAQKWVDYDMEKYGKISDRTNDLVKKAGFQIVKDDHGDYEVAAGHFEALKEEKRVAPRNRDDIDAIADDKKERAKAAFMRKKDDADSDKDYQLKRNDLKEPHEVKEAIDFRKNTFGGNNSKRVVIKDGVLLHFNDRNVEHYTIPSGVICIADEAFQGLPYLESVTIPEGVKSISYMAFCFSGLEHVEIPSSVEFIGNAAFPHHLTDIDYKGTLDQWLKITKENHWFLGDAVTVRCSDGNMVESKTQFIKHKITEAVDKIRLIWDDAVPTAERRWTEEEDIKNDIHIGEFTSKEALRDKLLELADYEAEDPELEGSVDNQIDELVDDLGDPGDGSPNILYLNINGKKHDGAYFYYDVYDVDLDHVSEDALKKAILSIGDMNIEDDDDFDESFHKRKSRKIAEEKDLTKTEGTIAKLLGDHMDEIDKASTSLPELKATLKKIVDDSDLADTKAAAKFRYTLDHAKNVSALLSTIGTWMSGLKVESLEKVELETATEKISISSEEKEEEKVEEEETILPVSKETADEILVDNGEELPDAGFEEIEELEDEEIEELGEAYLKNVYENVDDFELKDAYKKEGKFVVEGLISFKSGTRKNTTFSFTPKQVARNGKFKFLGENLDITSNKNAFTLSGRVSDKKLIPESLTYNYGVKTENAKTQRVYGRVKTSK